MFIVELHLKTFEVFMFIRIFIYSYRFFIYQKIVVIIVLYVKIVEVKTMFYILRSLYLLDNYIWYSRGFISIVFLQLY